MQAFAFEAIDSLGRRVRGVETATNAESASNALRRRGLLVLTTRETRRQTDRALVRVRSADILATTRSVAALLDAGMPLIAALGHTGTAVPRCATLVHDIRTRVEKGDTLYTALRAHPKVFSGVYTGVIAAGERTGDLAGAFRRMVAHLETQAALRARLTSAAIYPALLAVMSVLATGFLVAYVLPRFASVLTDTGIPLPRSTSFLIGASVSLQRWWPALIATLLGSGIVAVLGARMRGGRLILAKALLLAPIIGGLRRNVLTSRFGALVSVMLKGGVPLPSALSEAARCIDDPVARAEIEKITTSVQSGTSLHSALINATVFSPVLVQLAAIGENSSRLADFLGRGAEVCTETAERSLLRIATLAEPAMILGFGLIVGFVAVSLLQAVYSVNGSMVR